MNNFSIVEESDLIPYRAHPLSGAKILVLAPHPDDETFGCGGALKHHMNRGEDVKVVFLTDGSKGSSQECEKKSYIALRREEATAACLFLGIIDFEFWPFEDRQLVNAVEVLTKLVDILDEYQPELVYVPSPFEIHPDHRAAAFYFEKAVQNCSHEFQIAFYEVGHLIPFVNILVDISTVLDHKQKAMGMYKSQLQERPYDEISTSLSRFRSLTLPSGISHAEAFFLCSAESIRTGNSLQILLGKAGILQQNAIDENSIFPRLTANGSKMNRIDSQNFEASPAVSVIVATYNRPKMLKRALQSILNQTYQDYEIIVVNDHGEDIGNILNSFEPYGLNIVCASHSHRRGAAAARNTGIQKAKGDYIAYLDDDDIFLPNHLEKIVSVLSKGEYKVVYTGSIERFQRNTEIIGERISYNFPFDRQKLLATNYIPTPCIAHTRSLLREVGLFDEDLQSHEDWDMWIRISLKYDFFHIDRLTVAWTHHLDRSLHTLSQSEHFLSTFRQIQDRYNHLRADFPSIEYPEQIEEEPFGSHDAGLLDAESIENTYFRKHIYGILSSLAGGKTFLDLFCKEGSGSYLLSKSAVHVIGLERAETVRRAKTKFCKDNLDFYDVQNENLDIPGLDDRKFDFIVWLDCDIDLLKVHMNSIHKLLKDNGTFLASLNPHSSPSDSSTSSLQELKMLVSESFAHCAFRGQQVCPSSNLFPLSGNHDIITDLWIEKAGDRFLYVDERRDLDRLIGIFSNADISPEMFQTSYLTDISSSLIDDQQKTITDLQNKLRNIGSFAVGLVQKKDQHIDNLENEIDRKKEYIDDVVWKKDQHISNLEDEIRSKAAHIDHVLQENERLSKRITQTDSYIRNLHEEHEQVKQSRDSNIQKIESQLNTIVNSKVWRSAELFRRLFYDRLLMPFPLIRKGFLTVSTHGLTYAFHKAKRYFGLTKEISLPGLKPEYDIWMEQNRLTDTQIEHVHATLARLAYKPKISIVMPVYNVDQEWLIQAIDSVLDQFYSNWELCIADDASTKPHVKKVLARYAEETRIKVRYLPNNLGISGASNEALKLATGEFVGLLDHDDQLAPDALYECVKLLNIHPDADLIYSDEDKLDTKGKRIEPFFKPDFSLDLLLSMNYICHFCLLKTKIVQDIGGFRKDYEGSQDYDLLLRFIEETEPRKIHHIPKILYHWRKIPGSAAAEVNAKDYAFVSAKKALNDYRERNRIPGNIMDGLFLGSYRFKRKIVDPEMVSIIIPFRDRPDLLGICLESIFEKTTYPTYEILLINNRSTEKETFDYLDSIREKSEIRILDYDHDFSFSAINNFAASKAKGEYILLLNNDVKVISDEWLSALVEHAQRTEVGVVGAKLLFRDGRIQHAGVVMGIGIASHAFSHLPANDNGYFGLINVVRNYCAVTGACMMLRKEVYEELGGFDEVNLSIAYNDVDLCLKAIDKGYLIVYTPFAQLFHYESETRGDDNDLDLEKKDPSRHARVIGEREFMMQKWSKYIHKDPFYNPNLTRLRNDFGIRTVEPEKENSLIFRF